MKKVEIGSTVKFIQFNVHFQGQVMDIRSGIAFVAVIGQANMFTVEIGSCLPVATGGVAPI